MFTAATESSALVDSGCAGGLAPRWSEKSRSTFRFWNAPDPIFGIWL